MSEIKFDYLLNKTVKIYQPEGLYHASTDAVWLAAAIHKIRQGDKILDVGSGTGAVSLCLAARFKDKNLQITGVDIQKDLVEAANLSAKANEFGNVSFEEVDVLSYKYQPCSFNHVISNPPYADADMPSPNISKATAHNFESKGLQKWVDFCIKALKPQGCFYMINRAEALDDIIAFLHGRLGGIEIFPLFSKPKDNKAKRVIVRAQKDSNAPLIIRAPIYVHKEDSTHSDMAEKVLRQGMGLE